MSMLELPSIENLRRQIMLTSETVWKHVLTDKSIEKWLANFTGEVFKKSYEHQLALWLLVNFVYYNENEVKHLCKTLYKDLIHMLLPSLNLNKRRTFQESLNAELENLRFYNLGKPGESSAFILYYFRQENNLLLKFFISEPSSLPASVNTIVFVDDVTLSEGPMNSQAYIYIKEKIKDFQKKRILLITFIASSDAKTFLENEGIEVVSCIILDSKNRCFSHDSNLFHHYPDHRENCKLFAQHYGQKLLPSDPLGFSDGQFLFGFFYNTPDNTLPIFWSDSNGWQPVIKRYSKHSGDSDAILERFI